MSNPKIILATFCVCLFAGTIYFIRSNSIGNIDRILSASSYTVNFNSCGCFGCIKRAVKVTKGPRKATAILTFYPYDTINHCFVEKHKTIAWNAPKETLLRTLFINGIRAKDRGGCTTLTFYSLESFPFSIKWSDGDCIYSNLLDKLFD